MWGNCDTPRRAGYRVHCVKGLKKPRLERETFSGGRNLSAIARNKELLARASMVYVGGGMIHVPEWIMPEFLRATARMEAP
jgi:hypothetical protein